MPSLYQLTSERRALDALFERLAEDEGAEHDEALRWLRDHEADLAAKVEAYVHVISELQMDDDQITAEIDRLRRRRETRRTRIQAMKKALTLYLSEAGETKVETPLITVSLAKNGGKTPMIYPCEWDADPASVPSEFRVLTASFDSTAFRKALLEGDPAATAHREFGERGTHVRIS